MGLVRFRRPHRQEQHRVALPPHGRAVQVDPTKPKLKPPRTKHLKLKCDTLLQTSAFKFNLRRYHMVSHHSYCNDIDKDQDVYTSFPVGRCRLTPSIPS